MTLKPQVVSLTLITDFGEMVLGRLLLRSIDMDHAYGIPVLCISMEPRVETYGYSIAAIPDGVMKPRRR